MDFSYNRIKHPDVDFITEDSLRKALYNHDITGVDDATLTQMMVMAKKAFNQVDQNSDDSSEEDDLVSKEEYKALFKSLKFKIDAEGRVNN